MPDENSIEGDGRDRYLPLAHCDTDAATVCRLVGQHVGEGRILLPRVVGRCQRCGVGMMSDGS